MKNEIIYLDKESGKKFAEEYFMQMCGYNQKKSVDDRIVNRSLETLNAIYDKINIKTIISEYEGSCIDGVDMLIEGETFTCKALSQIQPKDIKKIYVFIITLEEFDYEETSVLNEVYYDMWQNSYVYVGNSILREHLQKINGSDIFISDSFGPGYYGMEVSQLEKFFKILDADKINVQLLKSGFMSPLKSFAGFYLATDVEKSLPGKDCENCMSTGKTCEYCKSSRINN